MNKATTDAVLAAIQLKEIMKSCEKIQEILEKHKAGSKWLSKISNVTVLWRKNTHKRKKCRNLTSK